MRDRFLFDRLCLANSQSASSESLHQLRGLPLPSESCKHPTGQYHLHGSGTSSCTHPVASMHVDRVTSAPSVCRLQSTSTLSSNFISVHISLTLALSLSLLHTPGNIPGEDCKHYQMVSFSHSHSKLVSAFKWSFSFPWTNEILYTWMICTPKHFHYK